MTVVPGHHPNPTPSKIEESIETGLTGRASGPGPSGNRGQCRCGCARHRPRRSEHGLPYRAQLHRPAGGRTRRGGATGAGRRQSPGAEIPLMAAEPRARPRQLLGRRCREPRQRVLQHPGKRQYGASRADQRAGGRGQAERCRSRRYCPGRTHILLPPRLVRTKRVDYHAAGCSDPAI